jgi:quinol monooxygenase YgiN
MTQGQGPYIRLAELEIDPARLESFAAAIREQIEAAVRVEPGVLALHAVSLKDDPTRIRVFEIYTDEAAYRTHLETPHFGKFREATETMVKSRKLLDANPIMLGAKPGPAGT